MIYSLANAHTLSRVNDDPQHSCRPFDAERSGFVIGEGGGALVLETEENALARGATIYAELAGWANNNDAYHVIKPNPDGISSIKCMKKALKQAGLSPQGIDYINAHGTGHQTGRRSRIKRPCQLLREIGIRSVFGNPASPGGIDRRGGGNPGRAENLSDPGISAAQGTQVAPDQKPPADQGGAAGIRPAVSSTKGATGHMIEAGGITESIACIQAIREGIVPPTLNLEQCDSQLDLVCGESRRMPVDTAMTNAFGFGEQNSSLIFRRYSGGKSNDK